MIWVMLDEKFSSPLIANRPHCIQSNTITSQKIFSIQSSSPCQRMKVHKSWLQWELSSTLIDYHQLRPNKRKLSLTLVKNLSMFKVHESTCESMRLHESFRPNKNNSLNSHQLASWFSLGITVRINRCIISIYMYLVHPNSQVQHSGSPEAKLSHMPQDWICLSADVQLNRCCEMSWWNNQSREDSFPVRENVIENT